MKITESLLLALSNIKSGKMRAFLTMLGIIIGISSVMVIIGVGNGMENYVTESFESMGANTLTVMYTGRGTTRKLTNEVMQKIVDENSEYLDLMSPTVAMQGGVKIGKESLDETAATGVGEQYFEIKNYAVSKGRKFRYLDMQNRERVCIVGSYIDSVWYGGNSIGQTIRIGTDVFKIVGVLEQEESSVEEGNTDDAVYIPYTTAARINGSDTISSYNVTVVSEDKTDAAVEKLKNELLKYLRTEDAYSVISLGQILDVMTEMINVLITVLAVIAAISLVVAGVGIMNIMLVSVSERTREIGIRKALGAKEKYILTQFVIEAAMISAIGGIVGIIFGYVLSSVATVLISTMLEVNMAVTPSFYSIVLAFGASAAIGIAFGYLPARKAAVLNPIDALRHE